ncbi:hypothetical protein [Streptomyces sp. Agncl-13]|uniref:hypothetical protein n=1 Tax=Streptomyces sp. Agncl-13 TaxID=3400628 RepID=UPI003A86995B
MDILRRLNDEARRTTTAEECVLAHGERRIELACSAAGLVDRLASALDPFLPRVTREADADVRVEALATDVGDEVRAELGAGTELVIDASLYPTNTRGRRIDLADGRHAVLIDKTATVCLVSPRERLVRVYQPDEGLLRLDSDRLIKGLATSLAEADEELVVHASAVVTPSGQAVLFPGDSRNGKTTILLHTLARFDVAMLSCDTSFLRWDGDQLWATGWPSNFSLSTGTLHDFDFLHALMTPQQRELTYTQAWGIYPKEVLDTREVIARAGASVVTRAPVSSVVFLNFAPEEPTGIRPLSDPKKVRSWIEQVCLGSRDPLYPNWHGYQQVSEEQVERSVERFSQLIADRLPVHQLDWAPGPDQLLRHVEQLDAASSNRTAGAGR